MPCGLRQLSAVYNIIKHRNVKTIKKTRVKLQKVKYRLKNHEFQQHNSGVFSDTTTITSSLHSPSGSRLTGRGTFSDFLKAKRVGTNLISSGKIFQRVGVFGRKTSSHVLHQLKFLGLSARMSGAGQVNPIGARWFLRYPRHKGDDQNFEFG